MKILLIKIYSLFNIIRLNINKKIKIDYSCIVRKSNFEGYNKVLRKTILYNTTLGYGTYIGSNCDISNASIGRFCSIASNVKLISGKHPTHTYVTTHPAFYSTIKQAGFTFSDKDYFEEFSYTDQDNQLMVEIGNDVWIGANVTIVDGVKIGNGVIIGANSFVNKDLDDFTIYGGFPAKKIRDRFTVEDKEFLREIKWWDMKEEWLKSNFKYFHDINSLKKYIELD